MTSDLELELEETQQRLLVEKCRTRFLGEMLAESLEQLNPTAYRWFKLYLKTEFTVVDALIRYITQFHGSGDPIEHWCDQGHELEFVQKNFFMGNFFLHSLFTCPTRVLDPVQASLLSTSQPIPVKSETQVVTANGQPDLRTVDPDLTLFHLLGQSGEFLIARILILARDLPWAREMAESSVRPRVYEHLNALQERGWLEQHDLDLRISNTFRGEVGKSLVTLTGEGRAVFSQRFDAVPVDLITPFTAKYKTVEAGVLIRLTQAILERWNDRAERRWDVQVVDAVWSPDEVLAGLDGAQRAYTTPDGDARALPDLIVQMTPANGGDQPALAVVEVERGLYKLPDLRAKWGRAMRCYPPRMIYIVAPNTKVCKFLYNEWIEQVRLLRRRGELAHDVNAAFYTLDELSEIGLLDAAQLAGLDRHNRAHPEQAVRLPRYVCEEKN